MITQKNVFFNCPAKPPLPLPSVWEEVYFDVGISRPAILSRRQVLGAQDGDNELMAHFIIPEFNLCKDQYILKGTGI